MIYVGIKRRNLQLKFNGHFLVFCCSAIVTVQRTRTIGESVVGISKYNGQQLKVNWSLAKYLFLCCT